MSKEQEEELVQKVQALMAKKFGEASPESMRKLFDAYDSNGDGKIEGHDLETLLADAGVGNVFTRSAWVKGILSAMDQNGDKHIEWAEFSKAVS